MKLGVNIDHVATLRQARGTSYPDPFDAARICASAGANGITIHLREDRRHIQDADVYRLAAECPLPINLEMAEAEEIIRIAMEVKPAEICLVPEKREELTTEGGLDVAANFRSLEKTVKRLQDNGSDVSLFVDPDEAMIDAAKRTGAQTIELHTGAFCNAGSPQQAEDLLQRLIRGAKHACSLGIRVNAGHGINLDNLSGILRIPHLDTLNIGHSIIARAVFTGLEGAVKEMIDALRNS